MTFERRAERLERLFAELGEGERNASRAEWRQLFASIMSAMDGSDVGEATRGVVEERYAHLPQEERDELIEQLLETFAWWLIVDMDDIRADRRNLIPPALRDAWEGVT